MGMNEQWRHQLWAKGLKPPPQILLNIFRFVKEHRRPKIILHLKCTRIRHFQTKKLESFLEINPLPIPYPI